MAAAVLKVWPPLKPVSATYEPAAGPPASIAREVGGDAGLAVGVGNLEVRRGGRGAARNLDAGDFGVILHAGEGDDDLPVGVGHDVEGVGDGDVLAAGVLEDVVIRQDLRAVDRDVE